MKTIPEKEYSFDNVYFWNGMLYQHIQAHDEEREVNLDEVWNKELAPASLNKKKGMEYWEELIQFELLTQENQGEIEDPNVLLLSANDDITLKIEFHPHYTYYFLNDFIIGEISGHFHLRYITFPELLQFAKQKHGDLLFHLLLPISAIREKEKEIALDEITKRLKQIPLFQEHADYIGKSTCAIHANSKLNCCICMDD